MFVMSNPEHSLIVYGRRFKNKKSKTYQTLVQNRRGILCTEIQLFVYPLQCFMAFANNQNRTKDLNETNMPMNIFPLQMLSRATF